MPGLKFAPLIRVSTEHQEKQGESLNSQRSDLEADIKSMGGEIFKWYAGQEHATPDYERKILDELISDAQQHKFNAIIIWSIDRWSRDDLRGPQDLKILKDNGIRFFVRTKEHNLNDEQDYFFIALYGLMGRTQSIGQTRKSVINRIHRAKQGFPTCGKLPYGRTYSKQDGWGIDEAKKKIVEDAAKRYLKGESLTNIAIQHKISMSHLNLILKRRSGDTWEQRFTSKKVNIDEIVLTTVPRLLPEAIIKKIHQRSEANKTFTHGQPVKNSYLLSRMIFCETCGYAMFGHENHEGRLYYRHSRDRDRHSQGKGCKSFEYIPADIVEGAVIEDIFRMLGDLPRIEQATKDAIPDLKELEELKVSIEYNEKELLKNKKSIDNLISQIEEGNISGAVVKARMSELKAIEISLTTRIDADRIRYETIPSPQDVKRKAGLLLRLMRDFLSRQKHLEEMTFDDKRKLLQYAFNGKDADGKRLGVYIGKNDSGNWIYTIKGIFYDPSGNAREIDHVNLATKPYIKDVKQDIYGEDNPHPHGRLRIRQDGH
ncbi:MAG: recombinase family protein [Pseudomonadota bacterium]